MGAEDLEFLGAVDRERDVAEQVRDEDEHEKRANERKPALRAALVHVLVGHPRGEVVEPLDRDLQTAGAALHVPCDADHHADRDDRGEQDVEHALVEVHRAEEVRPGFEVVGVDDAEPFVLVALEAVDHAEDHEADDVDGEDAVEDLAPAAHRARPFLAPAGRLGGPAITLTAKNTE